MSSRERNRFKLHARVHWTDPATGITTPGWRVTAVPENDGGDGVYTIENRRTGSEAEVFAHELRGESVKRITVDELDGMEHPALADILALVNGGKYEKFFLKSPREFKDGSREYLTRAGGKAYSKLTTILYALDRLTQMTDTYNGGYTINDLVEELDEIVHDTE